MKEIKLKDLVRFNFCDDNYYNWFKSKKDLDPENLLEIAFKEKKNGQPLGVNAMTQWIVNSLSYDNCIGFGNYAVNLTKAIEKAFGDNIPEEIDDNISTARAELDTAIGEVYADQCCPDIEEVIYYVVKAGIPLDKILKQGLKLLEEEAKEKEEKEKSIEGICLKELKNFKIPEEISWLKVQNNFCLEDILERALQEKGKALEYANCILACLLSSASRVKYSVHASRLALHFFEKAFPEDESLRKGIDLISQKGVESTKKYFDIWNNCESAVRTAEEAASLKYDVYSKHKFCSAYTNIFFQATRAALSALCTMRAADYLTSVIDAAYYAAEAGVPWEDIFQYGLNLFRKERGLEQSNDRYYPDFRLSIKDKNEEI